MDLLSLIQADPDRLKIVSALGGAILLLGFAVISIVLVYHWKRYGIHKTTVSAVMIVYFLVSIILLYSMAHSLTIILQS